jgi:Clp amino terminal domain, pathogenicity island component
VNDRYNFTAQAQRVLDLAKEEARRFQHNYVGTEHLLLGLIHEKESIAAGVLANLGVELNKVHNAVEFIIGRGDRIVLGEISLTPRAKKVIELSADEARRLNHHAIGTEHLLLGLIREGEGIAAGVLESLGVNLEKVREQTMHMLGQSDAPQAENSFQIPDQPVIHSSENPVRGSDRSDLLQEEDFIEEFGLPDLFYEESDSNIEGLLASLDSEEEFETYGWSQEASDNLSKIAADAAKTAQQHPGLWVNPLKSYLLSRIRYAQTLDQIRQFLLQMHTGREFVKEHLAEYSGGYFQIYSPKMDRLFVRVPEEEATSLLKNSWYEEFYQLQDERYSKIIRLIKRIGGLETDKIRAIQSRRCFIERSPLADCKRFVSADRRFPISVSYPRRLSFFYDFNDERNLHVDWDKEEGSVWISRENFGMSAQSSNKEAKLVLQGKKDISQFMLEDFAQGEARALMAGVRRYPRRPRLEDKMVGERTQPIEAKRLVWLSPPGQYEGEWVFFMRARLAGIWSPYTTTFNPRALLPELWVISNTLLEEKDFNVFLSSFQFLSLDFFRSLPAQY